MKIRQYTYFILCMSIGFVAGLKWVIRHGIIHLVWTYLYGMSNASESEEAAGIVRFVRERFSFNGRPVSSADSNTVFCMPGGTGILGRTPHRVMVHDVIQKHQQDQIIDLIQRYKTKNHLRTVKVYFFGNGNRLNPIGTVGSGISERKRKEVLRSESIR